jgi:hypothetical protein
MADATTPAEPGQQQSPASPAHPPAPAAKIGFGVTALVLGLVGILFCWIPLFGLILPILALIFGGIGIYLQSGRGMAVAGLVIGLITFAVSLGTAMYLANRAATG